MVVLTAALTAATGFAVPPQDPSCSAAILGVRGPYAALAHAAGVRNGKQRRDRPPAIRLARGRTERRKIDLARAAKAAGWGFVACGEERLALLAEWQAPGRQVSHPDGARVLAAPRDGAQYWNPDVDEEMIRRTQKRMGDDASRRHAASETLSTSDAS